MPMSVNILVALDTKSFKILSRIIAQCSTTAAHAVALSGMIRSPTSVFVELRRTVMERIFKQLRVECRRRLFLALHFASKTQKLVVPIGGP
jgi:hypothetical protein